MGMNCLHIFTEDHQRVSLNHYTHNHSKVILIAHGFYSNKDTYLYQRIAALFEKEYDVISFDFRGHGKSGGLFSWTAHEEKDLRAIVEFARHTGYTKIGVIGFSLGAAIVIIEASKNRCIQSVITVSAPYDFWRINCRFWKKEMLDDLTGNLGKKGKGKGVRPGNPFLEKIAPIDVIYAVAPTPIFFIHGEKDWLISSQHSKKLFNAAQEPKRLAIISAAGHAEMIFDAFPDEFERVCHSWFAETL